MFPSIYRFKCTPDDAWQKQLALGHLGDLKHSFKSSNKSRYQFLLLWQFRWWLAQVNEFSNLESFSSCIRFQNMYVYFCIFIFSDVWTSDSNNFKLRQYKMHSSNDYTLCVGGDNLLKRKEVHVNNRSFFNHILPCLQIYSFYSTLDQELLKSLKIKKTHS